MIATFFGDKDFPIEWDEGQKELFWVYDDLHIPNPVSPMYADIGGWWLSCDYMFRRFGTPFASDWLVKIINGYVYTAAIPAKSGVNGVGSEYGARYVGRTPVDAAYSKQMGAYLDWTLPYYADHFLDWWRDRFRPEMDGNFLRFDSYDYDGASLLELAILLEEVIDIHDRHWKFHWLLNFSQFSASAALNQAIADVKGEGDRGELMGRLQASTEDRNWDSIEGLWRMKEFIKGESGDIAKAFRKPTATDVFAALKESKAGRFFIADQLEPYLNVFGHKSMWAHEFSFKTWRENPVPAIEAIRGYLEMDYDFRTDLGRVGRDLEAAKAEVMEGIPASEDRDKLARACAQSEDESAHARPSLLYRPGDERARSHGPHPNRKEAGGKGHAARRRGRYVSALQRTARGHGRELPRRCVGPRVGSPRRARGRLQTSSARLGGHRYRRSACLPYLANWGFPEKFYRKPPARDGVINGLPASGGVVEGTARVLLTPEDFDKVQKREIAVCRTTSPAWVVLFTRIGGLVTDAGGMTSHPAVVSREFGVPAVVGTSDATLRIKTGDRVRVNGSTGQVDVLSTSARTPKASLESLLRT